MLGREIHGVLTQGPRRLLRHISSAQTFTTGSGTVLGLAQARN